MSFWDTLAEKTAEALANRIDEPLNIAVSVAAPKVKCPVCEGTGHVPIGFYPHPQYEMYRSTRTDVVFLKDNTGYVRCRSCKGSGIV